MTMIEASEAFTNDEFADIMATAKERGVSIWDLMHDAVMNALY